MKIIEGQFNTAKVFTDVIDNGALEQIKKLCDQEYTACSVIRIMPDAHSGAGCTIGTTMTIADKAVPNLVGVDAGRLVSRNQAKNSYTLSEFKKQMAGIYTTSVNEDTLDECPMEYKDMDDIVDNIGDTAEIIKIIRPVIILKPAKNNEGRVKYGI